MTALHNEHVEIGYFDSDQHSGRSNLPYAQLMHILEYGASGNGVLIKPFSLFTNAAFIYVPHETTELKRIIKKGLIDQMKGNGDRRLLTAIGQFYQRKIRAMFGNSSLLRDLRPDTVRRKQSTVPLIETGELRANLGYRTSKSLKVHK
tara:strand:- start:925 stop:1368 length:444 start_codon:yes stop_codon:yes gene_type:complete